MENENKDRFFEELKAVVERYDVKYACICGTLDNKFLGLLSVGRENLLDVMMSIANAGRLWQHARTAMRSFMDGFEKGD
jgi:hypothetical protein